MSKFPLTETTNGAVEALITTMDVDTGTIVTNTGTIAGDTTSLDAKTPALGSAAAAASSPTTIATDDPHMGAVGTASDVDGVVHGQLRYIGEAAEASRALLSTIDADTGTIAGDTTSIDGKTPALGAALAAASVPTVTATDSPDAAVLGAVADVAVTTDANGTISAKLRGWIVLLLSFLAQVGQAIKTYGLAIVVSDGTNSRLLRGDTSGYLQPVPKYKDAIATNLTAATANTAPVDGSSGVAFSADCLHAYVEVFAIDEEVGVSNVDVQVYVYEPNSATWNIQAGGSLVDLQLETNNRWGVMIPVARLIGTRVFIAITNYVAGATTIKVTAKMTEVTLG